MSRAVPAARRIDEEIAGLPIGTIEAWRCEEDGKWKAAKEPSFSLVVEDFGSYVTRGGIRVKLRFVRAMIVCGPCAEGMKALPITNGDRAASRPNTEGMNPR